VVRAGSRRVGLSVVVFIALCAPFSASTVASAGGAPDLRSALPSTGTLLTVRFPLGACGSRRTPAFVTVTDRQKRPLARVRVTVQAGTRISPAIGVTDAMGKLTLMIRPNPFRRGALTLTATARPTDRPAVTKQLALPAC
jgi:hypothetical protein